MPPITYRDAGVDLASAASIKERIKLLCGETQGPAVVSMPGFFAGAVEHPLGSGNLLVASTDSVGTKVRVAEAARQFRGLGHDIVNHCINDIFTTGAAPLFFLDYIGIGKVDDEKIIAIVEGLTEACAAAGCAVIGGETALLGDTYQGGDFDLVGFIVGVVDRQRLLRPKEFTQTGDVLIGVPSSGPHTNGYSLVRKVFDVAENPEALAEKPPELGGQTIADALLASHRSYLPLLTPVLDQIRGMAHITGGGVFENLPRCLPQGLGARIDLDSWTPPGVFQLIQRRGEVDQTEMFRVFNMGVGMILIVEPGLKKSVLASVEGSWELGVVAPTDPNVGERVLLS